MKQSFCLSKRYWRRIPIIESHHRDVIKLICCSLIFPIFSGFLMFSRNFFVRTLGSFLLKTEQRNDSSVHLSQLTSLLGGEVIRWAH